MRSHQKPWTAFVHHGSERISRRLLFEWRARNFDPEQITEVEVRFEPVADADDCTRIVLEHRGWDAIPADHPARHGLRGGAFCDMIGLHWGELLTAYRGHAKRHANTMARG